MRQCLTNPEGGYYTTRRGVFGKQGDFITSPEITQVFGELIGVWTVAEWMAQGRQSSGVVLIEFGPGKGTLMDDMLRVSCCCCCCCCCCCYGRSLSPWCCRVIMYCYYYMYMRPAMNDNNNNNNWYYRLFAISRVSRRASRLSTSWKPVLRSGRYRSSSSAGAMRLSRRLRSDTRV